MSLFLSQTSCAHVGYLTAFVLLCGYHHSQVSAFTSIVQLFGQATSMTPNAAPVPLVPGASFRAQVTQMVWVKCGTPNAGIGIKVLLGLQRPSDSQESIPNIFGGGPCKGFASTPQLQSITVTIWLYLRRLIVLGSGVWQTASFQLLPKLFV